MKDLAKRVRGVAWVAGHHLVHRGGGFCRPTYWRCLHCHTVRSTWYEFTLFTCVRKLGKK